MVPVAATRRSPGQGSLSSWQVRRGDREAGDRRAPRDTRGSARRQPSPSHRAGPAELGRTGPESCRIRVTAGPVRPGRSCRRAAARGRNDGNGGDSDDARKHSLQENTLGVGNAAIISKS